MADAPCFDLTCEALETGTSLDRLEARGTVRLALKDAGLDPRSVTPAQMSVVVDKLLPPELDARGVADGDSVCARIRDELSRMEAPDVSNAPEAVFARLGGE